ncbi:MAG: hypothetical protein E6H74_00155 [Betaproteobacteria bacterium]|nr:MAG: hypothetical protein E6H74_00155 [Betaproteobacteria bacterium]
MKDLSKDAVNELTVDETGQGQRIDNFLMRVLKGVPKSHIYRILRSGEVRVNRKRARPDVRLAAGDLLRIPPIRTGTPSNGRERLAKPASFPILYEDDAIIAVDKPAGLAVHGGSGIAFGLIEQLRASRPNAKFLELVHRLDRDTSGVLLIAKQRASLVALHKALREGRVDKRYLVLVKGKWRDAKRQVELPLTKFLTSDGERRVRTRFRRPSRAASGPALGNLLQAPDIGASLSRGSGRAGNARPPRSQADVPACVEACGRTSNRSAAAAAGSAASG